MTRWFFALAVLAVLGGVVPGPGHAADPAAGQAVFKTQCGICHTVIEGKNMVGPSLFGLIGRTSGSVEGFRYSAANKAAGIIWSEAALDKYLTSPREAVPGTTMTYAGLKDEAKRADLIAFLSSVH